MKPAGDVVGGKRGLFTGGHGSLPFQAPASGLARWLAQHGLDPDDVKITIEFPGKDERLKAHNAMMLYVDPPFSREAAERLLRGDTSGTYAGINYELTDRGLVPLKLAEQR